MEKRIAAMARWVERDKKEAAAKDAEKTKAN
jgi:hypothetical protein